MKSKKLGWTLIVVGAVVALTTTLIASSLKEDGERVKLAIKSDWVRVEVIRVVDGDTIDVGIKNYTESVRLIGIDAPEFDWETESHECFAHEARMGLTELLEETQVFIELDPTQDRRDIYDRLLAYVFVEDGTNINQRLIEEGLVEEFTFRTPYTLQEVFQEAESFAQQERKGLWGVCL